MCCVAAPGVVPDGTAARCGGGPRQCAGGGTCARGAGGGYGAGAGASAAGGVTVRDSSSHLENDYALSDARILADGSLFHSLETKPRTDTLAREVGVQVRDSIVYREKVVPHVVSVEKELNWFAQLRLWLGNVMLALIAGAVAWAPHGWY